MKLLLVEDNRDLSHWLAKLLGKSHYVVDQCFDGEEADEALRTNDYALVILDITLPKLDGLDVLRRLRARGATTPVLLLTAIDSLSGRVAGLDGGADDYMIKPFEMEELEARIRAQLRRVQGETRASVTFGALDFDTRARHFAIGGVPLALTPREHAILESLILRADQAVSKAMLLQAVYGFEDDANPSALEVHVHRLRKKLDGSDVMIATLRGLGYMLRRQD